MESLPNGRRNEDDTYSSTMASTTLVETFAGASTTRAETGGRTVTSATDIVRGAEKTEGREEVAGQDVRSGCVGLDVQLK